MAKSCSRTNGKKKNGGIVMLKIVIEKLQKSLRKNQYSDNDVKEGHFGVIAVDEDEAKKRFVVPLSYLTHPSFLRLLEQAAEEYGFDHVGALTIPCRPSELETILQSHRDYSTFLVNRPPASSCNLILHCSTAAN